MTARRSRLMVKLCGFVYAADVEAANALDVDALGFVLAEDARVPLPPRRLTELFSACDARLARVAVVGPKSRDECRRILELGFDAVQVVVTDWFSPTLDDKPVIPVLFDAPEVEEQARLLRASQPRLAEEAGSGAHGLLCLDGPSGGGRGVRADWTRAARIARTWPLLLAGGLRSDNVAAAIAEVGPAGVDVSSGIESAPGQKDHGKMAAFVAAVRATEGELC
jgi:phosphoribosylanthranilate isomerase